ncbi:MAG: hypothetical protein ACREMX_12305 [Gemmatimonadales bacterium]
MPPPYAADTNVYVRAANEPSFRGRFETFVQRHVIRVSPPLA